MTNTTPITAVTELTITDLSEVTEGVCQGDMNNHGFVLVGEEKFFLGLDVLQACGFSATQFKDGVVICFASIPATPSAKIAVVTEIETGFSTGSFNAGKANDEQLRKALESKPQPKKKPGKQSKPKGKPSKPVIQGSLTSQPRKNPGRKPFFLKEGDRFGATAVRVNGDKGFLFVSGVMVYLPEDEAYYDLKHGESIRFGAKGDSKDQLFVHVNNIPRDETLRAAIESGETFAVELILDNQGRLAGSVIGLLGNPDEEASSEADASDADADTDEAVVDLKAHRAGQV